MVEDTFELHAGIVNEANAALNDSPQIHVAMEAMRRGDVAPRRPSAGAV